MRTDLERHWEWCRHQSVERKRTVALLLSSVDCHWTGETENDTAVVVVVAEAVAPALVAVVAAAAAAAAAVEEELLETIDWSFVEWKFHYR